METDLITSVVTGDDYPQPGRRERRAMEVRFNIVSERSEAIIDRFRHLFHAIEPDSQPSKKGPSPMTLPIMVDLGGDRERPVAEAQISVVALPPDEGPMSPDNSTSFQLNFYSVLGVETEDIDFVLEKTRRTPDVVRIGEADTSVVFELIKPMGSGQKVRIGTDEAGAPIRKAAEELTREELFALEKEYRAAERLVRILREDLSNVELNPDVALIARDYYEQRPELIGRIYVRSQSAMNRRIDACKRVFRLLSSGGQN